MRKMRRFLGMSVGDPAEILKRTQFIARNAVARGIHPAELPLRQRISVIGRILQRRQRLVVFAGLERGGAGPEGFDRRDVRLGTGRRTRPVKRQRWRQPERAGQSTELCETIHLHS